MVPHYHTMSPRILKFAGVQGEGGRWGREEENIGINSQMNHSLRTLCFYSVPRILDLLLSTHTDWYYSSLRRIISTHFFLGSPVLFYVPRKKVPLVPSERPLPLWIRLRTFFPILRFSVPSIPFREMFSFVVLVSNVSVPSHTVKVYEHTPVPYTTHSVLSSFILIFP